MGGGQRAGHLANEFMELDAELTELQAIKSPVFDTSVLVAFSSVGEMGILKALFPKATIPGAVFRELVMDGKNWVEAAEAQREAVAGDWLETVDLSASRIPIHVDWRLDDGEREVISLALAKRMLPILDERPARRLAQSLGLVPIGSLGLLAIAKERGIVPTIGSVVTRMRSSGLRFADKLLVDFLKGFGERWPP